MRVLLLASAYFPFNAPCSHRVGSLARDLPKHGWDVDIVCPEFDQTTVPNGRYDPDSGKSFPAPARTAPLDSVPYRSTIRIRILRRIRRFLRKEEDIREPIPVYRALKDAAEKQISARKYDLILATSPQPLALHVAHELSGSSGVPWIADFRDIPTEFAESPLAGTADAKKLDRVKDLLETSAGITVVSPAYVSRLNVEDKPSCVVFNGFDAALLQDADAAAPKNDRFHLLYCGSLAYGRHRQIRSLFDAMDALIRGNVPSAEDIYLEIVGPRLERAEKLIRGRLCEQQVEFSGPAPYLKCLEMQRNADALLLLSHHGSAGIIPSKLFEYMGAQRPVLSIPKDESMCDRLIQETQCGFAATTAEEIKNALCTWIKEWNATGTVETGQSRSKAIEYTRQKQGEKMAKFLSEIANGRSD